MVLTFYWYPKCGTCKKAKQWLDDHNISYEPVDIVKTPPAKTDLLKMLEESGLPAKTFFNTSGRKYRELGMKDKISELTIDEMAQYLASDGMLIKRPIVTDGQHVSLGFKESDYQHKWLKQ